MRFTGDMHRRGLLRWSTEDVKLNVVGPNGAQPVTPNGLLLSGHAYSFLDRPLGPDQSISLRGLRPWKLNSPFAWYELAHENGLVKTDVWQFDGDGIRMIHLAHVPAYGFFQRLVIEVDRCVWKKM